MRKLQTSWICEKNLITYLQNVQCLTSLLQKQVLNPFFFCIHSIVKMVSKTDGPSQQSVGQCLWGAYKNVGELTNVRHLAHLQTTKATKWHSNSLHKKTKTFLKKKSPKSPPIWPVFGVKFLKNARKLGAQARNHVFIFRRFTRSRQSSGRASKLAFFEAFPL